MRQRSEFIKHLHSLLRWSELRRWYRYHFPLETEFFDGKTRLTKRGVSRVFKVWRKSGEAIHESEASYEAYPGGDFIDIGAYEGFYSLLFAPKAVSGSKFLALEPDARFYSKLLTYLGELKKLFPHIEFYPLPLACGDGKEDSIHCTSGIKKMETVSLDSLVSFLKIKPTFIKIDVEGLEYGVLQGMKKVLSEFQPIIMLEVHPKYLPKGVSTGEVTGILLDHGYRPKDIHIAHVTWRQLWKPDAGS